MSIQYQPPKYSDKELLQLFPEAKMMIPQKLNECEKTIREKQEEITAALREIYILRLDAFSEWFGEELVRTFMMPELTKLEKRLLRLNHLKYLSKPTEQNNSVYKFEEKIENARQFPIAEMARSKLELKQFGTRFVSLCPFHNEKTPSFYIYTESNKFYCFGCQEKGDVINLTMALHGINFKEAVEMLQN